METLFAIMALGLAVTVDLDHVTVDLPSSTTAVVSAKVSVRSGRRAHVSATARGSYTRRTMDPSLGRTLELPGGTFTATARGRVRGTRVALDFDLELAEPGHAARVLGAKAGDVKTRLRGSLAYPPLRFTADVVQP